MEKQHLYVLKIKKWYKIEIKLWLWINTIHPKATFDMVTKSAVRRAIELLTGPRGKACAIRQYNVIFMAVSPKMEAFYKENSLPKDSSMRDVKAFARKEVAHLFREYSRHMALRLGPRN